MARVLTGAIDWRYEAWNDEYYPEDMPEDWQLGYFANEFSTVVIDTDINTEEMENIVEQLEDCHERFHPILRFNASSQGVSDIEHWIEALSEVEIKPAGIWLQGQWEIQSLGDHAQALPIAVGGSDPEQPCRLIPAAHGRASWLILVDLSAADREIAAALGKALQDEMVKEHNICVIAINGHDSVAKLQNLRTMITLLGG